MTQQKNSRGGGHIGGVSLSSFLQMLEQDSKSCTLTVSSDDRQGSFYFEEGVLIDAQYNHIVGEDAAYAILLWENPFFTVTQVEDRMRRIHLPLAHILLDSAKQQDEGDGRPDAGGTSAGPVPDFSMDHPDPAIRKLVQSLSAITGVKHYFLMNRQGKMIIQSSRRLNVGDFLAYCIVSGIQMRNALNVKGPSRIQLMLENGETLLVFPGAGVIIGLLLDSFASVDEVTGKIGGLSTNR